MPTEDLPAGNGARDEEIFPPEFNDEWAVPRNGRRRPTADRGTNDFPDVGEMPIPNVSPMTAHYHLAVLRYFCRLLDAVESKGADTNEKARLVQQFLVCAEARYIRYLALLDEFAYDFTNDHEGPFNQTMPLPPWDVAIVFHAHCLSPFRFYTDMNRRGQGAWNKGIAFPLERMYALIHGGIWSDAESEHIWTGTGGTAYQLWEADPSTGTELQLQDVEICCAWCSHTQTTALAQFTEMHTTKTAICECSACGRKFNADNLSAKFFKDDMSEFIKLHRPWNVKGAISGMYESKPEETAKFDLGFVLETVLYHSQRPASRPHLSLYVASAQNVCWKDILHSMKRTTAELKAARIMRLLSRPSFFKSLEIAYMGIVWRDLSIDLVAAALRQREFSKKIVSEDCAGIDTPFALFKATTRYHKFLLLMRRIHNGDKKKAALVPTLDIDLCWHTHQLYAVSYRQWCIEHLGVAINHDDTVGKEVLNSGLRETSLAWYDAYRESYSTDDLRQTYFSKGRTAAGVLFPPYGLFMRKMGQKLNQAQKQATNGEDVPSDDACRSTYPYWLMHPDGWDYPAACASGSAGKGGWAASVDLARSRPHNEVSDDIVVSGEDTSVGSKCAGCVGGGCSYGGVNYNLR